MTTDILPICLQGDADHEHDISCSARFYREFFGCDVFVGSDGIPTYCVASRGNRDHLRRVHMGTAWTGGTVPDILGSPESDASWQAARDVLRELNARDIAWVIMNEHVAVGGHRGEYEGDPELPRAVALAAWGAVSDD